MRNTPNTSRALCVVACRESRDVPRKQDAGRRSRCGDNVVWCHNTPTDCVSRSHSGRVPRVSCRLLFCRLDIERAVWVSAAASVGSEGRAASRRRAASGKGGRGCGRGEKVLRPG